MRTTAKMMMISSLLGLASVTGGCATQSCTIKTAAASTELAPAPDNRPGNDCDELWGERVADPYRWLEDISNPEVLQWAQAQDARAHQYLEALPGRDDFVKALDNYMYSPAVSVPVVRGGMAFWSERNARDENDAGSLYVRPIDGGDARVIIDAQALADDGSVALGKYAPSPDGKRLAYMLHFNNSDKSSIHVMDVETGKVLPDVIETRFSHLPQWLNDHSGFYYRYYNPDPDKGSDIRLHIIGTDVADDQIVFSTSKDNKRALDFSLSTDNRWLVYKLYRGEGNSILLTDRISGKQYELPTKYDISYEEYIAEDALYLLTNDDAPNYKIIKISLSDTPDLSPDNWQVIVNEAPDAVIERFTVAGGRLFVITLKDVVKSLDAYETDGRYIKSIALPDKGSIGTVTADDSGDNIYFSFTSFKYPVAPYRLNTKTLELSPWRVIGDVAHVEDIISEQLFATSKDGTRVPVFVLRHKDTKLDGTAKTIIEGYGGFNVAVTPIFTPSIYPWLLNGGIYAYAVLRGGSEYGDKWRREGMRLNKQNTFDDFYAVTQYLIDNKYTRPSSVAAYGASNGGLLTGAALTQRPDLFGAILSEVPVLDMLRSYLFEGADSEYGSPVNSEEEFRALRAYSPYANVKRQAYPAALFLTGDSDDRANPLHARKMTAAIQDATTSQAPVLLRIEHNAGHSGSVLTRQNIAKWADIYTFLNTVLE